MVTAPVERSEVRGHRQQIGKSAALTSYVVLSLPNFRLVRSRSLSLGAWVPKNLARRTLGFGGALPARPARAAWAVQRLLAARW